MHTRLNDPRPAAQRLDANRYPDHPGWKIRVSLTGEPYAYTPAERKRAEAIHATALRLEREAQALDVEVLARLSRNADADVDKLHDAVASAVAIRLELVF